MAENAIRNRQFEYKENSNLVLTADRDARSRRGAEPTGEVESLNTHKGKMKMGDRITRDRPPELEGKIKKSTEKRSRKGDAEAREAQKKAKKQKVKTSSHRRGSVFMAGKGATVLTETEEMDSINYRPKTRESRLAYEELLSVVQGKLGDQPQDILRGAAEEVLAILKDDSLRDPERQKDVGRLLRHVEADQFNKMVNIGKRINDFAVGGEEEEEAVDEEEKLDEDMGVAVVFDEEEEDDDSDVDEVRDSEDEDEDMEGGVEAKEDRRMQLRGLDGDDGGMEDDEGQLALNVHSIDAFWLQRGLGKFYDDAEITAKLAEDVLKVLSLTDEREVENKLVVLLDYDKFDFVKVLLHNRAKVYYCTRLKQAQSEADKAAVTTEMAADEKGGGPAILQALGHAGDASSWNEDRTAAFEQRTRKEARALNRSNKDGTTGGSMTMADDETLVQESAPVDGAARRATESRPSAVVDLDSLAFAEGSHFMSNTKCELPEGAWRAQKKGYEEVHVPAVKSIIPKGEKLVSISDMPEWCQPAFQGMDTLNRIQSKMMQVALETSDNILLCAPTGAGKTNVAMMSMLQVIGQNMNDEGEVDLEAFKIVYIAPMKALVHEVVANFGKRLKPFGMKVMELSGDQSLSREQIAETQVIVTTPEKWDIVTRKAGDRSYTSLVRLIIIDEVHLLHDTRGVVLESICARTIRKIERDLEMTRIVGLSATLPNYADVATFLRVDPAKGLFYFDNSFRPVPLQQQYIGVTEKKAIKRFQVMNDICYEKVMACMPNENGQKDQVLIFVHSRAETGKTAEALRELIEENDVLARLVGDGSATEEILRTEAENAKNTLLKELLPFGLAIHHAGMTREDRNLVEDLYSAKHVQVLVSTATLAWGVNLPAHTVILKGTQMYYPDKGRWDELSPLDVLQMMGRAGRPQFDDRGEGIVITQHARLQFYLSLNNQQLPIESQLVKQLADHLNAEIVLGSIQTVRDAAIWLGYTYLYVRMMRNPNCYSVPENAALDDPRLFQHRVNLVHSAANMLDRTGLVKYDRKGGSLQATALGRVASYYYLSHTTMQTFNEQLKPTTSDIELFRLFSQSDEFQQIVVREEEKLELAKLAAKVPIPIKEGMDEPSAKVNALLQAYISNLRLEGFALLADMTYVRQSAARILRALFEIALKRGWAALADKTLTLCKMVERRCWLSQSPLRQFSGPQTLPEVLYRKLERKDISWDRYGDLSAADLGELVKLARMGKVLHKMVHSVPKIELSAAVQPVTRSLLRVELTLTADFAYDEKIHGMAQQFWVIVTDGDGESILHYESFLLKKRLAENDHLLTLTVPVFDPLPPQYFVKVVSDRWLHSEAVMPISFRHLVLPAKFPPHTELLDLQPLPLTALGEPSVEKAYADRGWRRFNPVQTQVFQELYEKNSNVLLCAPTGSGKTAAAEFALVRLLRGGGEGGKCVYVCPKEEVADQRAAEWKQTIGAAMGASVVRLTGESAVDLKLVQQGRIVVATAEQWDTLSRRWRQRTAVQEVALFLVDDLHLLGSSSASGPCLEVVVSRMRYMGSQTGKPCRIVGLASSVGNAKEVGDWMGASSSSLFNFHPSLRPVPLELHLYGLDVAHFASRMLAMAKPAFNAAAPAAQADKPVMVFVSSRKQAQITAIDLMSLAAAEGEPGMFLQGGGEDLASNGPGGAVSVKEGSLQQTLDKGVGFLHSGMSAADLMTVKGLFRTGRIKALVLPRTLCWAVGDLGGAQTVVVMGTEEYDGREHRYVDYPVADVLQMIGLAGRAGRDEEDGNGGKAVVLCHTPKKDYLRRLLQEPLPIESHLDHVLSDHINAEVVTKTIENKQEAVDYLTWTFFYRRLTQNPNYYNMAGVSHRHLSDYLSELVEQCVSDLEEARCVSVEDDMVLGPLNLGMVGAYYYINYTTVELFANSVTAKTKLKGILDMISSASEFNSLPVRSREERLLQQLTKHLPQALPKGWDFSQTPAKAHVLLQAHFSRTPLGIDLRGDQAKVVGQATKLVQALVDVISSNGWLKPAIEAMELSQMVVQAVWQKDSYLRQLPHVSPSMAKACEAAGVETPLDVMELEDEQRQELLPLGPRQMADVARFCNAFPNVELSFEVEDKDEIAAGEAVSLSVTLQRDVDEEDEEEDQEYGKVVAPYYPKEKSEGWWLIVGDKANNSLLAIKKVSTLLGKPLKVKLDFLAPEKVGTHKLHLLFMCDSYLGCDQEYDVDIDVGEAEEDDEDEDDDDEEEGENGTADEGGD